MEGTNHEPFFSSQLRTPYFQSMLLIQTVTNQHCCKHEEWLEGGAAHLPALTEGKKEARRLLPDLPPLHGTQG